MPPSAQTIPAFTKVVTANKLNDGTVVFLDAHFQWTNDIAEARIITAHSELEDVLLIAERAKLTQQVVSAYNIDVALAPDDGGVTPLLLREKIRAFGPTTVLPTRSTAPAYAERSAA